MDEKINPVAEFMVELSRKVITYKLVKEIIKSMPDEERLKYFDNAFDMGYIILNPKEDYEKNIILITGEPGLGMTYKALQIRKVATKEDVEQNE